MSRAYLEIKQDEGFRKWEAAQVLCVRLHSEKRTTKPIQADTPQTQNRLCLQYREVSLHSSRVFFFQERLAKAQADITAKFGTDSLRHMFYKLLNGNFSIASIRLAVSKVIEMEKDEGNLGGPGLPRRTEQTAPGDPGVTGTRLFIVCILHKYERRIHSASCWERI